MTSLPNTGARAMQIVQHARINVDLDYRHLANDLARQLEIKEGAWASLEDTLRRRIAKLEDQITGMAASQLEDNTALIQVYDGKMAAASAIADAAMSEMQQAHAAEVGALEQTIKEIAADRQREDVRRTKKEQDEAFSSVKLQKKKRAERKARCAVFDRHLHPRMPLVPTPARWKLLHAWDPMAFLSGVHFLTGSHCKLCPTTEGTR
jgi:hypothetical protein